MLPSNLHEFPTLSFQGLLCQGKLVLQTIPIFRQLSLPLGWFSLCLILQSIINSCLNRSLRKATLLQALGSECCGLILCKIKNTFLQHRLPLICLILVILIIFPSFHLLLRGVHTVYLRLTYVSMRKFKIPKFGT